MSAERSERLRRPQRLDDRAPAKPHATAQPGLGPGAVLALQRTAGNRAVQQLLGARLLRQTPEAPAATAAVDPWPAIKAIDAWRVKADARLDGTTAWETANWIEFLGRTSSDPILSLADSELAAITSNAVGNLLTEVGREGIQKGSQLTASAIGAAIGTAAEPGVGTVIGFVVGVLIEAAASYMFENFTGKRDAGETAAEAAERVTRVIQKQHTLLTAQHKLAAAELETLVGAARDRAEKAETQDEVDAIAKWATGAAAATLPPPELGPSYPLASELLRFWALEHAADLSSARPGTDPGQFESVVADTLNGLEAQPSLFVFQTRAEWDRAGLDHKAESGSMLAAVESLVAEVGMPLVGTTSAPAFTGAGDAVQAAYQGHETEFSGFSDPDKARWFIFERNRTTSIDKDWLLEKLQQGRVRVYCALEVSSVSDSVAVDAWHWRVEIDLEPGENPNPGPGGVGDPLPMDSGTPADTLHIAFDSFPSG